ncbi:unnamed protein product [Chironomus riparius]|uniref:Uncharacterized protein n=1 Tax=Chironomus riparius TaxID=315576 RepID=A0A9N9WNZ4_9DIPT|nr:unnamed protein product [Chironomus riparius]
MTKKKNKMTTEADQQAYPIDQDKADNVKKLRQKTNKGIYCFDKEKSGGFYQGANGLKMMIMRLDFLQSTRNRIIKFRTDYKKVHPSLEKCYNQLIEKEIDLEKMIESYEAPDLMDENFSEDTVDPDCLF